MEGAKAIRVEPISRQDANALVQRVHYSGRVAPNSQLHLGVFWNGLLEGAMQFGPSMDKKKLLGLVKDTGWNGFIELNRMAFSQVLPRNSESRAIAVAMRMIRKAYPQLEWVVSFADATQCGDGTIYRASGFVLTKIGQNSTLWRMPDGSVRANMTLTKGKHILKGTGKSSMADVRAAGGAPLQGFQLRYVYFLNPAARARLTVPEIPFSAIAEAGAAMYLGQRPPPVGENQCPPASTVSSADISTAADAAPAESGARKPKATKAAKRRSAPAAGANRKRKKP